MPVAIYDLKTHPTRQGNQPEAKAKKHRALVAKLQKYMQDRRFIEMEWLQNIAFVNAKHWYAWDGTSNQFFRPPSGVQNRTRAVLNDCRRLAQKRLANNIGLQMDFGVLPQRNDPGAEARARTTEKWLRYLQHETDYDVKFSQMSDWLTNTGNGCLKAVWDEQEGPYTQRPQEDEDGNFILKEECPACRGTGLDLIATREAGFEPNNPYAQMLRPTCQECQGLGGIPILEDVRQGDVDAVVKSPFDIVWATSNPDWRKAEGVFEREIMSVQQFRRRFGAKAAYVPPGDRLSEDVASALGPLSRMFQGTYQLAPLEDDIEVWTYYAMPSTGKPHGWVYTFTSSRLIEDKEWKYPQIGHHPFAWFTDFPISGSVYGRSMVTDLRQLNVIVNQLVSQMTEAGNLAAAPPLLKEATAVLTGHDKYPRPGRFLTFKPGLSKHVPAFMTPPAMPAQVDNLIERLTQKMESLALVQKEADPSSDSGRLIALLGELAKQENAYQAKTSLRAQRIFGNKLKAIGAIEYDGPRQLAISGTQTAQYFTIDFGEAPMSFNDVIVTEGRMLSDMKSVRIDEVKELAQFVVDPVTLQPDMDRLTRMLQLGSEFEDYHAKEFDNAQWEVEQMMESGEVLPVSQHDYHIAHIKVTKAAVWALRPDDQRRQPLEAHLAQHEMYAMQARMQELQMQHQQIAGGANPQDAQGGAPGNPSPSGGAAGNQDPAARAQQKVQSTDAQLEQNASRAASR